MEAFLFFVFAILFFKFLLLPSIAAHRNEETLERNRQQSAEYARELQDQANHRANLANQEIHEISRLERVAYARRILEQNQNISDEKNKLLEENLNLSNERANKIEDILEQLSKEKEPIYKQQKQAPIYDNPFEDLPYDD